MISKLIFIEKYNIILDYYCYKMHFIEPSFEIDEKGRVVCKEHSNYNYFMSPDKDYFYDMLLERQLTCKTCSHYFDNNCYFQKSEIDAIELNREKKKKNFRCTLCGGRISIMLSIIQKIYNEEKFNIKIPLVCCNCYERIKNDEFMRESRNRALLTLLLFTISFFFLFLSLFIIGTFNLSPLIIFLYIVPWFFFIIWEINKIITIVSGVKFYKKFYKDGENELILIE
jgi:hypothetical protein